VLGAAAPFKDVITPDSLDLYRLMYRLPEIFVCTFPAPSVSVITFVWSDPSKPIVCDHPDGSGVNESLAHVYVDVPVGLAGIVIAHL